MLRFAILMPLLAEPEVLVLIGITTIALISFVVARQRESRFNQRWPPLSDDEFIAKCSPGASRDIALRVRRIISEQLDIPYERIHPDQDFVRDLDCC